MAWFNVQLKSEDGPQHHKLYFEGSATHTGPLERVILSVYIGPPTHKTLLDLYPELILIHWHKKFKYL